MVTRNLEKLRVFYFKPNSGKWRTAYIKNLLSNICPEENYILPEYVHCGKTI